MSFSPYTLSGHEFFGGGVELKPDNGFRFAALYGRFRKAVQPDSTVFEPMYRRMGSGFLMGYEGDNMDVSVNLFKASDQVGSLDLSEEQTLTLPAPAENVTGSVVLSYRMANGFSVMGEYGLSAINHDIGRADSMQMDFGDRLFATHGTLPMILRT